jgi:nucleotide-binding universal stress UspA family protein
MPRRAIVVETFNRILLATEGTEFDVGAERVAIDLAAKYGLPLLAVRPVVSNPEFEIIAPQLAEKAEAEAVMQLDKLREAAKAHGVELLGAVRRGEEPYQEIVAEAREREADLIVLRRRGKHGYVANRLIGPMVHTVIGHSPCDVLIVPRAAQIWSRRILIASDGSSHGDRAVEMAASVAMRSGLPVTVVSVLAHSQDDKASASANIERALAALQEAGTQATGRIASGKLHEAILGVVREVRADLIVLGRRGMGGVERLLLGSTAERVAGHADCPVLIVHA